jgi:hypothetical protein
VVTTSRHPRAEDPFVGTDVRWHEPCSSSFAEVPGRGGIVFSGLLGDAAGRSVTVRVTAPARRDAPPVVRTARGGGMVVTGSYRTKAGQLYVYELQLEDTPRGIAWSATVMSHRGVVLGRPAGTLFGAQVGDPFSEQAIAANAVAALSGPAIAA